MSNTEDLYPDALFKAHLLLLRWGRERLAQEAAEGDGSEAGTPSAAGDGSGEPINDSLSLPTRQSSRQLSDQRMPDLDKSQATDEGGNQRCFAIVPEVI